MSDDVVFDDTVKICGFYASSLDALDVDLENHHITMDGYGIDPVMENGYLVSYLVEEPDGTTLFVNDLDYYFQTQLADCWEDRS